MLAEAPEAGTNFSMRCKLAFPCISYGSRRSAVQTSFQTNAAFQTKDLRYFMDSDCEISRMHKPILIGQHLPTMVINPFHLKKAQRIKPTLYDGIVISAKHVAMPMIDDEETLILEEESQSKILCDDLGKRFTPQQELSVEQTFWLRMSNPVGKPFDASLVKIEAPKELLKVSLVNESLKKVEFHLAKFDNVVKIRTTHDAHTEEFFENNDLKAQLPEKDSTICKLKDIIKSMREKSKEENVNYDYCEIETKNVELENSVAKLLSENEHLCNEINHVKQVLKEQFESIKKTRVHTKEQSDSLIDKLNLKSVENEDLKAQIQDKLDLEPLAPRIECSTDHAKSAKKHKKQNIWKPTGHVFTEVGLKWKPTGRTFTIVGNSCPLTRITSANVVPPKKITSHSVETQKPELKVYSRKPKNVKNVGLSKKAKIVESKNANHLEPNHTWGSNATNILSSSSLVMTGIVRFGNDHIARIIGYGDYQLGNVTISRVYYVDGLGHNLFSIGQFCDADLEVAFQKNTCFIRNLEASKTKSWLWYHHLSHLNFAYALGKSKKSSHQPKAEDTNQEKLYLLHMDVCGPMRVASINGKRYILVIVDDYSRFTWVKFLRSKDEAPEAIIKCIKNIKVRLNTTVRNVRTYNGTDFVNQTLREFYENVSISHQTSVARTPRTPQQNGVVERRNRTLVEAARTMLIFSKAPLFLWAEAINTACYTQNRSLIRLRYNKTPYELMQDKKPDLSFFHVFGSLCYPTNDNDDLGKLDAKADIGIFVGYAPAKKAFRIYNKRTRKIIETIHVTFDELTAMASEQFSSGPGLHSMTPTTSNSGIWGGGGGIVDSGPEEEEFEEEEEPQEKEDDMEVDIEEDKNEPELTYPYEEMDPLNPLPPTSESEPKDVIEIKETVEPEDETVPASVHEVGESSTATFLREDSDGLFPSLMRRDINSLFDLGNEVRSSTEEGMVAMKNLVRKLGNAEEKAKCKKLKKELEEARFSNTLLRMQNERVERDLYRTRVRAHEFYREMIRRGFMFEERPNETIDVPVEDEKSPSTES
ncbi:retrovirus-related pol polyprotein from transposon TNT 1-94 [Tanacetum coccineum]